MSDHPVLTDVNLADPVYYSNSVGDTWDPAWAEDDRLYTPGNDGSGWDAACSSNLFFVRLSGDEPGDLAGEAVNCMAEYGGWAEAGHDECTWKSAGCLSLDGVLYLSIARHRYGRLPGDPHARQIADRASIIMSTDKGRTWQRPAEINYRAPMFGRRFATPYFIHYGRDGAAPARDNANRYVYAISNNGFWCNGDDYVLGRVERSRIARLDPADWEYFAGGDGSADRSWSVDPLDARPIIRAPLQCGETGATYLAHAERYVLVAWHYPGDPNVDTDHTRFTFYESPAPWGPWTPFAETVNKPDGWYCPRVLSRWQAGDSKETQAVMVTGGDYWQSSYYRFTVVPISLKRGGRYPRTVPEPPRVYNDDETGPGLHQFSYEGQWEYEPARFRAYRRDEHHSANADDSFIFAFAGSRIRWYGSKGSQCGIAAVSVDNGDEIAVDCHSHSPSTQFDRLLFDSGMLPDGEHTMRVRVTGRRNEWSKGHRIYSDRVEVED